MKIGKNMENKLFNLLCQLEAVHKILEHDGNELTVCYSNSEKEDC